MSITQSTLSRALVPLLALGALLLAAPVASAASPEELAQQCINKIHRTAIQTAETVGAVADRGVHKIETLDTNDRPVPVLHRAAAKSNVKIEKQEIKGARKVNNVADRCIRLLARGAPNPALIAAVNDARALAIGSIHEASIAAHLTIRETLVAALEDEEVDDIDAGNGASE